MEKCTHCDKPATLALRAKDGTFTVYLCWGCLIRHMRRKLKVERNKIGDTPPKTEGREECPLTD